MISTQTDVVNMLETMLEEKLSSLKTELITVLEESLKQTLQDKIAERQNASTCHG